MKNAVKLKPGVKLKAGVKIKQVAEKTPRKKVSYPKYA